MSGRPTADDLKARLRDGCNLQQRDGEQALDRIEALERERDTLKEWNASQEKMIRQADLRGDAWKSRAEALEAALATMTQERDGARQANREMVMETLAAYGQAQEAYEAQVKAEAALATARDGVKKLKAEWYLRDLTQHDFDKLIALIDGGRT